MKHLGSSYYIVRLDTDDLCLVNLKIPDMRNKQEELRAEGCKILEEGYRED